MKKLEGHVATIIFTCQSTNASTFNVKTSKALHAHTSKNERVIDFGCNHHMAWDASP